MTAPTGSRRLGHGQQCTEMSGNGGAGRTGGDKENEELLLLLDQPPTFLLDAAFCGIDEEELTALL